MFIDIHVHTRMFQGPERNGTGGGRFATPEELIAMLKHQGVSAACALPAVNPECSWAIQSNEEILWAAREYPDFIIPFMNLDPRQNSNSPDADLAYQMQFYAEEGCKGIGEVCASLPFDDPRMENLFKHAQDCKLSITFHIAPEKRGFYGIIDELGLPGLEGALAKFPELKFLGHSQPFWAEISGDLELSQRNSYPTGPVVEDGAVVRLMRDYPNLYGDLSAGSGHNAVSRDPQFGYAFMTEFQDRLFFGTDICDPRNQTPLIDFMNQAVENGHITREVYQKITHQNAQKLLGLEVTD